MKEIYVKETAARVGCREWQVENCIQLLSEGATIPFISRYRKEKTGGLDDLGVAQVKHWAELFEAMEKRKETILQTIAAADALDEGLRSRIEATTDARELEDLYLPYKPKRRTRATVAREAGLEPLADRMYNVALSDPESAAAAFAGPGH